LEDAISRISELSGLLTFSAYVRDGDLVITYERPTEDDEIQVRYRVEGFEEVWRRYNATSVSLVQARGFDDTVLVPVSVVRDWLEFANCRTCSLGLSRPTSDSPPNVIAVLSLGSERKRRD